MLHDGAPESARSAEGSIEATARLCGIYRDASSSFARFRTGICEDGREG